MVIMVFSFFFSFSNNSNIFTLIVIALKPVGMQLNLW